ncbi:MAG: hypothetical protein RLZZ182_2661 [Pseudomonadota bacterium]
MALEQLLTDYLASLSTQRRLADRTVDMYARALQRLTVLAADLPSWQDVGSVHVRQWVRQLHGQGLSARSIAIELAAWRGFFAWLSKQGLTSVNPVVGIKAPKAAKPLPKALAVDMAVELAEASATPLPAAEHDTRGQREAPWLAARDRAMVELMYGCGLRNAELLGLDTQAQPTSAGWLDLQAREAHVLGKGSKRRMVPIGQQAWQAVQAWLAVRQDIPSQDCGPALFVSRLGARLTAVQLRNRLKAIGQQAGLPTHVHPHMLRHSFASHLLQSSGDLRGVQELLGHAHITTTQVYTRLDFQHLAKVYDAAHPRATRQTKKPGGDPG